MAAPSSSTSSETTFETALEYAKKSINFVHEFNDNQVQSLKSIYSLNDTVAVLPTGSGKSIIFQTLPWLLQKKFCTPKPLIVIVVCPLNSIMIDQVSTLSEQGLPACYITMEGGSVVGSRSTEDQLNLGDESGEECADNLVTSASLKVIKSGQYNIIYMHPETIFTKEVGQLLRSKPFKKLVCCTVIDEVHMISEWGQDFRRAFSRLGELTSLFPDIPHVALTATATPTAIDSLSKTLLLRNVVKIVCNPDRPNIYIEIKTRLPNIKKFEKYDDITSGLLAELKEKGSNFPLTIVYCDNLESLGYCFQYLLHELGSSAYDPQCSNLPEDRIIAQFHNDYTERMKSLIINELRKSKPKLKLVLATVALGMGLNAPSIQRVIHMRPPTTLENYLQEIGRAGRNGQEAQAICYYNMSDIATNRKGFQAEVRAFVQNVSTCLRQHLLKHFGHDNIAFHGPPSKCCSNCSKQ